MNRYLKVIQLYKNENKLIDKALKNNRRAQHILYELHAPKMLSVCRYYIRDIHHAEEVMLNGFFKVFSNLEKFRKEGSFEGWIRRTMVRESISFLRKHKQFEFSEDNLEVKDKISTSISSELELDEIQRLIDELPEGYKIVFNMSVIEGYKHHEIAELLNISIGTSKSQLYKSRKMLQQKIKELNKTSYGNF